jgi:3-phosphoshikimate 1-carboxyvinyltransferase
MRVSIGRSNIAGRVLAPSSKSYTIRGLMCAALAGGESELVYPLLADDTAAAGDVLTGIGVGIARTAASWRVSGGNFSTPPSDLDCRESAATLRFMTAIAAAVPGSSRLTAKPSLARRPIEPLISALRQIGVDCTQDIDSGAVTVKGGGLGGGIASLPGNISSQYVSALLLIAPLTRGGLTIRLTTALESRPYVEMTIECLHKFGISVTPSPDYRSFTVEEQRYRPARYVVEGDWSSVSYLLALGATAGHVSVDNLNPASLQGDKSLLEFMKRMGAAVTVRDSLVSVSRGRLQAIDVDLTDCIDLLPTVAVVAALAEGTSRLRGIARARIKESDRVSSVRQELAKAGIVTVEDANSMTVVGAQPRAAVFDSHGDHRIAMAFSVLATVAGSSVIEGAECVAKTYPGYWQTLVSLGGEVDINVG